MRRAENRQNDYCRLCDALSGRLAEGHMRRCDTVLYRTPSFVLLPAIGPLCVGHAMVVSRKHFASLATMPESAILEYDDLIQTLLRLSAISGNLLEAEHGGTTDDLGGGCIAHTHINILPGLATLADLFSPPLDSLSTFRNLSEIKEVSHPYIMIRSGGAVATTFKAHGLPSQCIRRILALQLGSPHWNWRTAPEPDVIESTITFWKAALGHGHLA